MNVYRSHYGMMIAPVRIMKALITSICFLFFLFTVLSAVLAFTDFGASSFELLQLVFGFSLVGFILSLLYLFNSSVSDKIKFEDDNRADR